MPKLQIEIKTATVDLESVPGGQVTVVTEPTVWHLEQIVGKQNTTPSIAFPLSILIIDWNLEGEDGKKLPITIENVGKLPYRDAEKIYKLIQIEKKTL